MHAVPPLNAPSSVLTNQRRMAVKLTNRRRETIQILQEIYKQILPPYAYFQQQLRIFTLGGRGDHNTL